jgi:thiosulfate/3-mercaptopyruvate sulfurtransferase
MTLITPEALAACLFDNAQLTAAGSSFDRDRVRVVDVRWYLGRPGDGRGAYDAGHIPGAIHLDIDGDLAGPAARGRGRHPLPAVSDFRRSLERAGIGSDHLVVAYDDVGGWVAARLWWMLDDLGHEAVAVLDGGLAAWLEAPLPLTTEVPDHPLASLALADRWRRIVDRDELRSRLGGVAVLDARAGERYRGETEPIDPAPGHIPTAVNAPTAGNLGPDGRFLPPEQLASRFRTLGAAAGEVVISCGSGVAACQSALAMRIAGLPAPILYAGSYSDWVTAGYPIAVGPEPGSLETLPNGPATPRPR